MGRPRIYDTPHFCLHTYVRKGHTYVEAYRNEWDPEKKRSRIAQRKRSEEHTSELQSQR